MIDLRTGLLLLVLALLPGSALAQQTVTVPDLTGMALPVAAAELNRLGIGLGRETGERWTPASGQEQNTIVAQAIAPGTAVEAGARVDVTVLRSPNVLLIYDDNDLTLVNQTGGSLELSGITFQALDGGQATYAAGRWGGSLRENRCAQIWSVNRNGPKGLDECDFIEHWRTTTNRAEHFWTGAGGTTQFSVLQNGVERGTCPVANPGRCELYLPSDAAAAGDVTPYVYFAYTDTRLALINNSRDQWMPLAGVTLINNFAPNRGAPVRVADRTLYGRSLSPVASVERLAPGQCILFTNSSPDSDAPPQNCDVIAQLNIDPNLIFWGAEFPVQGNTSNERHTCPAGTAGRLTLCIMPR
jgi:hypothetical protein